jgi:hypothetical protein
MAAPLLSVERGAWVLVEDASAYQGRVVVVIGVIAVVRVACQDGGGDSYRAAELRCCRPGLDAPPLDECLPGGEQVQRTSSRAMPPGSAAHRES